MPRVRDDPDGRRGNREVEWQFSNGYNRLQLMTSKDTNMSYLLVKDSAGRPVTRTENTACIGPEEALDIAEELYQWAYSRLNKD